MAEREIMWTAARVIANHFGAEWPEQPPRDIPEGAMRVAPGSDAVVWKISPEHSGEL